MPNRPRERCDTPGCPGTTTAGGRCPRCRRTPGRESAAKRGYGRTWRAHRLQFLAMPGNLWCRLCRQVATVADHWPRSRRQLVAARVADPDAFEHLRPLCAACHATETAAHQPGGFRRRAGNG